MSNGSSLSIVSKIIALPSRSTNYFVKVNYIRAENKEPGRGLFFYIALQTSHHSMNSSLMYSQKLVVDLLDDE